MKNTIKSILAFAALMLCGGAWADGNVISVNFRQGQGGSGDISSATEPQATVNGNIPVDAWAQSGGISSAAVTATSNVAYDGSQKIELGANYTVKAYSEACGNLAWLGFNSNDTVVPSGANLYLKAWVSNRDRSNIPGYLEIQNVPFTKYDVYVYFQGATVGLSVGSRGTALNPSSESVTKFDPIRVDSGNAAYQGDKLWTVNSDGLLVDTESTHTGNFSTSGPTIKAADCWGARNASSSVLGSNVVKIPNCSGNFKISYWARASGPAAVQIVDKTVAWSNLKSDAHKGTHFSMNTGDLTLHLNPTQEQPEGSVVAISTIKIANESGKNMAGTMTINNAVGTKQSATESFSPQGTTAAGTINCLYVYKFATPALVRVGKDYRISVASESQFSAIADVNSPIRFKPLSNGWENHHGYCSVEGEVLAEPTPVTLPNTISYNGEPSDWQSTGVSVNQVDSLEYLKEIANRYAPAATFGDTNMDATPRDGTPLNVTLHSDGVLTVEMQVVNGGHKKAALVGFKVDGGLLKVKRIKSAYAPTTFNGPLMTYTNGTATRTTGTSGDGAYILANVTLTRITKFKDAAAQPDFLSTTAPIIRYDASAYDNFTYNENGEVLSWKDLSDNSNNATSGTATKGRVAIVNGVPAYEMGVPGSGIDLAFTTRATDIRTVFWVMDIRTDGNKAFFLGDVGNDCYDFHRGEAGQYYASQHASNNVKNGTTYCDGSVVTNPTGTTPPAGLHVYALKTTGNVSANRLSQDRTQARNGGRAISELVVFNTALTDEQIAAMNKYLLYKWMGIESGEVSATLTEGSQNFSTIAWNDGGVFANGKDVTLEVGSTTALTIDEEVIVGSLTLTGAGTLTINNAQNLSFGSVDISDFTGTINYNVDATRSAFTASEGLKALMKSGTDNMTFTFTGSGSNGATVDYGSTQDETTDVIFSCHIVFNGGTHALKYVHEKAGSKFGANATAANPTLLVTNNATLNFTGKNWCGWSSGAVNANGIIRVNSGSTLNASTDSVGTFYWAQQFYLEPGSTTNFRSNNQSVRFNGGINESAPQIYVPECAADKANKIATVNLANSENLDIINEGTGGSAFFVGANATLKIGGNLIGNQNFTKYGDGILQITGNVTNSGTKTIAAGLYDIGAMRDFTTPGWTVSGTGGFLIHETSAEYAKADLAVTNPNNYTIKVIRPNGSTVYDLATVVDDTTIKISGAATSFDITYTNSQAFVYKAVSGATSQADSTITYNKTGTGHDVGARLKHHPYINNIGNAWFEATEALTLAVVGTMSEQPRTTFIHMGYSIDGYTGLLIATGEKKDEVIIAWNDHRTVSEITRMSVPNAASERHVYIVTKSDVGDKSTFTVYLDGKEWKTVSIDRITIKGGVQVGSDFGGEIHGYDDPTKSWYDPESENYFAAVAATDDTGLVNLIRVYDRVITKAEIAEYSKEDQYPYYPPHGASTRVFAGETANWIENEEPPTAWSVTPKGGSASSANAPTEGSSLSTTLSAENTTVTINVPAEGVAYEELEVIGSGSATFVKGAESGAISISGTATLYRPITVKPGAIDFSKTPITLMEDGALTFDYSDYDVMTTYVTTTLKLTGEVAQNDAKITFTAPTTHPYHTVEMSYDADLKQYVMTITPNHQKGDNVYATNKELTSFVTEDKTATVLFPTDVVVIKDGYGIDESASRWQISLADAGLTGHKILVNYTSPTSGISVHGVPNGMEIEIATDATMFFREGKSIGDGVSISGAGTLSIGTPVAINGTVTISSELEFNAGGKFTSGVNGKSVKHENGENNSIVYSLIDTATDPIQPSDDPDAPAVVIDDIGTTGVTLAPGAKVVVPTTADTDKISVKYTIPSTGTVKDLKADGLVTVAVNQTTGAIELTTTESAKPAETAIAMATPTEGEGEEAMDKVQFTITNPIPGLFYAVSTCDTPNGIFASPEGVVGDQATSAAAKTVSIPMEFSTDKKVKYYKVSVKATK